MRLNRRVRAPIWLVLAVGGLWAVILEDGIPPGELEEGNPDRAVL